MHVVDVTLISNLAGDVRSPTSCLFKGKGASVVTFGAICSSNNFYLDYLINSVGRW